MDNQLIVIICILLAIESIIFIFAAHPRTQHLFNFLPSVFWIYFLPMVVSTAKLIPQKHLLYDWATKDLLTASLFLLFLGVDLKAIMKLGSKALALFLIGSAGIMLGAVVAFSIFRPLIGGDFWSGFGALSASWTGGSANMVAVKEAIKTPDDIYLPMVVVDTIIPYVWMGLLVAGVKWQKRFDQWNRSDSAMLKDIQQRLADVTRNRKVILNWPLIVVMVVVAFAVSYGLKWICGFLPVVPGVVTSFTWRVILVSTIGLICSLTPLRRWELSGSTKVGYILLFFVLACIGAQASLSQIGSSVILIGAGMIIVFVHIVVLLLAARWLRAPMMLVASASQANIGGVASAPIVAETYQPGLWAIGLLMAVLGNIIGSYLGIITAHLCRLLV